MGVESEVRCTVTASGCETRRQDQVDGWMPRADRQDRLTHSGRSLSPAKRVCVQVGGRWALLYPDSGEMRLWLNAVEQTDEEGLRLRYSLSLRHLSTWAR